jgi:hypothetical protein
LIIIKIYHGYFHTAQFIHELYLIHITQLCGAPRASPCSYSSWAGGLRHAPEKECLTVLDFVGQVHRESKSNTALNSPTGQNLVHYTARGYTILVFAWVRKRFVAT